MPPSHQVEEEEEEEEEEGSSIIIINVPVCKRKTTTTTTTTTEQPQHDESVKKRRIQADAVEITTTTTRSSRNLLHLSLKPQLFKLCNLLNLPDDVITIADKFLHYVINNHNVHTQPLTLLHAFQLALCWTAASLLKHKLPHNQSLALAKHHFCFDCKKEEVQFAYSQLRCFKMFFLHSTLNLTMLPSSNKPFDSLNKDPPDALSSPASSDSQFLPYNLKHFLSEMMVAPGFQYVKKDFLKSINSITKKTKKQMTKLLDKYNEEYEKIQNIYRDEKTKLETGKKAVVPVVRMHCIRNISMMEQKVKIMDDDYANKLKDLKHERDIHVKRLEELHEAVTNKVRQNEAVWVEGMKSWAKLELANLPSENSLNDKGVTKQDSEINNLVCGLSTSKIDESSEDQCACPDSLLEEIPGTKGGIPQVTKSHEDICDREVPSSMPENIGLSSDCTQNHVLVNPRVSGEQVPQGDPLVVTNEAAVASYNPVEKNPQTEERNVEELSLADTQPITNLSQVGQGASSQAFPVVSCTSSRVRAEVASRVHDEVAHVLFSEMQQLAHPFMVEVEEENNDELSRDTLAMEIRSTRILPISASSGYGNHEQATALPTLYKDPIQNELERIENERERTIKIHQELKSRLLSERDKEIRSATLQIRMKYIGKVEEIEGKFKMKKDELDMIHRRVSSSKMLAEAFRLNCMHIAKPPGKMLDLTPILSQQLAQLSGLQWPEGGALNLQIPPRIVVLTLPKTSDLQKLTASHPNTPATNLQNTPPNLQHVSAPNHPGSVSRPPDSSSISSAAGNVQRGFKTPRAPTPHMPSLSQLQSPVPGLVHKSATYNKVTHPEGPPILPRVPIFSRSAMEMLRAVDNTLSSINPKPPTNPRSKIDSLTQSEQGHRTNPSQTTKPADVVCVSDDD
ncbi:hypothetical protein ACFE04_013049 [Oxalis oulophora]